MHILLSIQSQKYIFVAARFTQFVNAAGVVACWSVVEFCCEMSRYRASSGLLLCVVQTRTLVTVAKQLHSFQM